MTKYNAFGMSKEELRALIDEATCFYDRKIKKLPKAPAYVAPQRYRAIKADIYWPGRS